MLIHFKPIGGIYNEGCVISSLVDYISIYLMMGLFRVISALDALKVNWQFSLYLFFFSENFLILLIGVCPRSFNK